ncbi:MAG: hypothetical protein Q4C11_00075 [Clostridium sp.]|nr:hypothetical protein [Clostridium sp.]
MQTRNMGKDTMIRAEKGSYLIKKDGTEIPKNNGYPENYKITTLIIPTEEIELYDEKEIDIMEDEE